MQSTQLSLIVKKLTEFYGTDFDNFAYQSPLSKQTTFKVNEIDDFVNALTQAARKQKFLVVENYADEQGFKELIQANNHPVIFFDESKDGIKTIFAARQLKNSKPFFYQFVDDKGVEEIDENQLFHPATVSNQADSTKDGKVRFLVVYPLENIDDTPIVEDISPMKRLFRMLGAERKDIGYIYIYAIVVGIISLTLPLGIQAIIGLVSGGLAFSSVYVLITIVILGVTISGVLQIYQQTLVEVLQRRVFAKAAFEFTYRIPRVKSEALLGSYAPELMNRFFDILNVQKALPKVLIDITAALIQILFGIILLSLYHPYFIAFGLLTIAIVTFVVYLNAAKGMETSLAESKYKYKVAQWLEDIARTLYAFKSAGSTNLPMQRMDYLVNNYLKYRKKHFKVLLILYGNAVFFKTFVTAVLLILGTSLVIDRQISLGQFVASEIIIVLVVNSVEKLISGADTVFDLLTAVEKMGHVTDLPLERQSGLNINFHEKNEGLEIKLKDLSYRYPGETKYVLKKLNVDITPKESICITGTNGSGKETLLKILSAIFTDFEGAINYNGMSIRDVKLDSIRDSIERNLALDAIFDGTLLDNIAMGRSGVKYTDVKWALDSLNLSDFIAELPEGLNTSMIAGGKRFSESFIAKISVARCVVEKPKLLMITDIYRELHKAERLKTIAFLTDKSNPWTLLTISNDPMVMAACDKVIVLNEGEIVLQGKYQDLIKDIHFQEAID
ncbi:MULTISPECIES: ATP-binding cassette domain-containing protein [Arcicella]|uniref:ATP-binding cassette domain-containing protein n=1 Tax=Arcicella lustrica TaxID=2984196 RepID=A0ABU5SL30_9BACT|nr:ATP-binding cassette domain-containing protein [Arcicella sp. DC25W]MEA5428002.1 ATP-binding cassette domain-containing protein [Arcicella sp. DC25W]